VRSRLLRGGRDQLRRLMDMGDPSDRQAADLDTVAVSGDRPRRLNGFGMIARENEKRSARR
jgi:hypothetical protein